MSGLRMLYFLKDWLESSQIYQYYTMALNPHLSINALIMILIKNTLKLF